MKTEDKSSKIKAQSSRPTPVKTACSTVHHYNGMQYCSTETVLLISCFLQTNTTSQTWKSGGKWR